MAELLEELWQVVYKREVLLLLLDLEQEDGFVLTVFLGHEELVVWSDAVVDVRNEGLGLSLEIDVYILVVLRCHDVKETADHMVDENASLFFGVVTFFFATKLGLDLE